MYLATHIQQFENFASFKASGPPYFLLLAGLLITLTCGISFMATLGQRVDFWKKNLSPEALGKREKLQILIPFAGTAVGICVFLASFLEFFRLPVLVCYLVAVLLTLLIASRIWSQIGNAIGRRLINSYLAEASSQFPQRT